MLVDSKHKPPFLCPGFSIGHPWIRRAELYEAFRNAYYRDANWVFCGSIYRRAGEGLVESQARKVCIMFRVVDSAARPV